MALYQADFCQTVRTLCTCNSVVFPRHTRRDEQPLDRSPVTSNMFDQQATSWFAAGSRLDQSIALRATTFKYSPRQSLEFLTLGVQYLYQGYSALCDKPASQTLAWKSELITYVIGHVYKIKPQGTRCVHYQLHKSFDYKACG